VADRFGRAAVFDPAREPLEIFERAVGRALLTRDPAALARAHFWHGYINYGLGEPVAAIPHCERALEAARAAGDEPLAVQSLAALGQAKAAACDYPGAIVLLDEAIAVKRRHLSGRHVPIGFAYSLSCKGFALGDMGQFDEAHACFEEAMAAIAGLRHPGEVSVLNQHAVVCLWQGNVEEARRLAGEGMQVAERVGSYYSHAMSRSIRAYAGWLIEPDPLAVQTIAEATAWLEAKERGQFTSLNYGWLAEMMVADGRFAEGLRFGKRALRRAHKCDRLGEAMALRALARRAALIGGARPPSFFLDCATISAGARDSPHEEAANRRCRAELAGPAAPEDKSSNR
jgi:tetratricopeptide (TPR) repeat protein